MKKQKRLTIVLMMLCMIIGICTGRRNASAETEYTLKTVHIGGQAVKSEIVDGETECFRFTPKHSGLLTITIKSTIPTEFTAMVMDQSHVNKYWIEKSSCDITKTNSEMKLHLYVNPKCYDMFIKINSTTGIGDYTVAATIEASKEQNPGKNTSKKHAEVIGLNHYYERIAAIDDTQEFFKIKVKAGQRLKFNVRCFNNSLVMVDVKNKEGESVGSGNAGKKFLYKFDEALPSGTYYIEIKNAGSNADAGTQYGITTGKYVHTKQLKTDKKITLRLGRKGKLNVLKTPKKASEKLIFLSSASRIVSVSEDGTLHANRLGTAVITVKGKDSGITKQVAVTVKEVPVEKVKMKTSPRSVQVKKSLKLKAQVIPADATRRKITWSSSDSAIASVSSNGTVKAKKAGTCKITASAGGKKAVYTLVVKPIPVSSVSLNKHGVSLTVGQETTLSSVVRPSDAGNKKVTYSSSNSGIASVSPSGYVYANRPGTAVITAKAGNKTDTCKITVKAKAQPKPEPAKQPKPEQKPGKKPEAKPQEKPQNKPAKKPAKSEIVSIGMESSIRLAAGKSKKITFNVSPKGADASSLRWKSSDPSIVSVSKGTIHAKKAGYATIIVEASNGTTAMCTVTVTK